MADSANPTDRTDALSAEMDRTRSHSNGITRSFEGDNNDTIADTTTARTTVIEDITRTESSGTIFTSDSATVTTSQTTSSTLSTTSSSLSIPPTDSSTSETATTSSSEPISHSSPSEHSVTTRLPATFTLSSELDFPTHSKSVSAPKDDGGSKLATGQIIGICLAGFLAVGFVLFLLGALLRWRRRRALQQSTVHLRHASAIWDLADDGGIDSANEKAARELGLNRDKSVRLGSSNSFESASMPGGENGYPPNSTQQPPRRRSFVNRLSSRLSGMFFPGCNNSGGDYPPPLQAFRPGMPAGLIRGASAIPGPGGPIRMLERQNTFGDRAAAPPRNNFFPPPPPQPAYGQTPLALPGQM